MRETDSLLVQREWRVIDQSSLGPKFHALESFAMDDTLCALVGAGQTTAVARAWVHHQTVVLGIQDTKLPFLKQGMDVLNRHGFQAIVRNSGGLAVVLDEGVLNLSLVFPETEHRIDINRGYDTMWDLIKLMFADFAVEIEAKEIVGSYCPGSYDLSIAGQKFAGISQRRIRNGVAVQIYLCVSGSGSKRAQLIKEFYHAALAETETKFTYPDIQPDVMASLEELLQIRLTISDVIKRFLQVLQTHTGQVQMIPLTVEEQPLFESYLTRIKERNEKAMPK
ncbi:lipoate--protein ligase family protein [Peribacillus asahii]|uniref:Octanoyl-[GcvH]:protein N-octanoyltransferase n=1 Tax=Peribacillus asahii TaxID=228899 RepID=A0A3Q9RMZ5_9BACI|nr:lipoate--protein ligase family protein [Peribacillus asahii]AZV45478.1 octanoyltransferase [Peribacillus asahii]USK85044.1 lipoate--protein ligase family protein [Peribacillus asahii]